MKEFPRASIKRHDCSTHTRKPDKYEPNDPRITFQGRGIKAERLENPDKKILCDFNYCNREAHEYVRVWFNRYFIRINHCDVHRYHFYEHEHYLKKIGLVDDKKK